tara:strand:+ start:326 stop:763 length:438 start_codon:yes stop_codon:yes gene_type:complete
MGRFNIWTDGSSYGNPGPSGYGFQIDYNKVTVRIGFGPLGESTNNVAEFTAALRALEHSLEISEHDLKLEPKKQDVLIKTDSQLLVNQYNGKYKSKNKNLSNILREIVGLSGKFKSVKMKYISRDLNTTADYLANQGSLVSQQNA